MAEKKGKKQSSRRCTICAIDWPNKDDFAICPSCEDPTMPVGNTPAEMSLSEAYSMKFHHDFERFYEEWDRKHDAGRLVPTADHNVRFTYEKMMAEHAAKAA